MAALSEIWALRGRVAWALVVRLSAYAGMTAVALWAEQRPAPSLPDMLIEHVPYVGWVDRVNYLAWLGLYIPLAAIFLLSAPRLWCRYMMTGALVSVARGTCIMLTGLGPPDGHHASVPMLDRSYTQTLMELFSPVGIFSRGSVGVYLTKDMFFSGHTATTLLIALYLWRMPRLRWLGLVAHVFVVSTVVFGHLHYAIDIIGAYGITFALYALREWQPRHAGAVDPSQA